MSNPKKLVFDIETIGEDFNSLDKATQENLTRWLERESSSDEEYAAGLEDLKAGLGFSPLTGEIVAIGVLDAHENKGAVYFQSPGEKTAEFSEGDIKYKPATEADMLREFWKIADKYEHFITFNGRTFDVPFLMIRSAVHGVRSSKDLMRGRYLYQQDPRAVHIDLLDQLSFYGALRRKGSLHLWTRAFGIESPKSGGVTGDDVGRLFKEKRYKDIARYNARDLFATKELFVRWNDYLRF